MSKSMIYIYFFILKPYSLLQRPVVFHKLSTGSGELPDPVTSGDIDTHFEEGNKVQLVEGKGVFRGLIPIFFQNSMRDHLPDEARSAICLLDLEQGSLTDPEILQDLVALLPFQPLGLVRQF